LKVCAAPVFPRNEISWLLAAAGTGLLRGQQFSDCGAALATGGASGAFFR